jgi:radical SAM protein with 4Fe4S-binding SPASM domain
VINEIKLYRTLNDAQQARIKGHAASVREVNGNLEVLTEDIINPNGDLKTNRLISIVPKKTETIVNFNSVRYLFQDLAHMNVILTNACNLSCTYCYEQHNKDFGRFTVESLRTVYDWLYKINNKELKMFQFFGGEPLIHKKLIIDFINSDPEYFLNNWHNESNRQAIGICSNGLLLDKEFIDAFYSKEYTHSLISIDTLNVDKDYRELKQSDIDKILDNIELIPADVRAERLTIRSTISLETAPDMLAFVDELYRRGIRKMIIHPLVLDSLRGFINWPKDIWNKLHQDILYILNTYKDFSIQFSEGVGEKMDNNCMIGADMIAIDASGDFSGCYFFTNQKEAAHETVLGNILKDRVYIDRYKTFQKEYAKMFEVEEKCKTCDYQNYCYQCPAGNIDTGPRMFRPDDMCQEIVKLFIDLKKDVADTSFKLLLEKKVNQLSVEGPVLFDYTFAYMLWQHLNTGVETYTIEDFKNKQWPNYQFTLSLWNIGIKVDTLDEFNNLVSNSIEKTSAESFYLDFFKEQGKVAKLLNIDADIGTLFYMITINNTIYNNSNKIDKKLSFRLLGI